MTVSLGFGKLWAASAPTGNPTKKVLSQWHCILPALFRRKATVKGDDDYDADGFFNDIDITIGMCSESTGIDVDVRDAY